jgi:hypothetical protein
VGGFDRYFIRVGSGRDRKILRLSPAERLAWFVGVLDIAAESPVRGALLIADGEPATAEDVAITAGVTLRVARAALDKLHDLTLLEDVDGITFVRNWDDHQPERRHDPTAAERQRRYREKLSRNGSRHA